MHSYQKMKYIVGAIQKDLKDFGIDDNTPLEKMIERFDAHIKTKEKYLKWLSRYGNIIQMASVNARRWKMMSRSGWYRYFETDDENNKIEYFSFNEDLLPIMSEFQSYTALVANEVTRYITLRQAGKFWSRKKRDEEKAKDTNGNQESEEASNVIPFKANEEAA